VPDDLFDKQLEQVERAMKIIAAIDSPELQLRTFDLLFGAESPAKPKQINRNGDPESDEADSADTTPNLEETGSANKRATGGDKSASAKKRSKPSAVTADRTVELSPSGKTSWVNFVAEKAPKSQSEKYAVAVYWLLDIAALAKATVNQVVYLYIAAKWSLPSDPRNAASQAALKGYLASGDGQDLKVASHGHALVENQLPAKK
jgi:hypothetical protein